MQYKNWSVARIFQQVYRKHPDKACFLIDERKMTFRDVEDFSNKVAAYFRNKGLTKGDCVSLLMETRPEYVCIWLGLSKLGVITALINSNLRRDTLLHSIKVAKSKCIIVGTELTHALVDICSNEEIQALPVYQFSDEEQRVNDNLDLMKGKQTICNHCLIFNYNIPTGAIDFSNELRKQKIEDLSAYIEKCTPKDKMLYVYTSGTTGLPKAAVITNLRYD